MPFAKLTDIIELILRELEVQPHLTRHIGLVQTSAHMRNLECIQTGGDPRFEIATNGFMPTQGLGLYLAFILHAPIRSLSRRCAISTYLLSKGTSKGARCSRPSPSKGFCVARTTVTFCPTWTNTIRTSKKHSSSEMIKSVSNKLIETLGGVSHMSEKFTIYYKYLRCFEARETGVKISSRCFLWATC